MRVYNRFQSFDKKTRLTHVKILFLIYLIFSSSITSSFKYTYFIIDQRNRDAIGDTALLSAFISLQTCATDLEHLKHNLDQQRQHFETLQEKVTALRDAR